MAASYWLMKSEPDVYSIDDLKRDKTTRWTGVRNYQARNFMSQAMKVGDVAIFYHSNAEPPGVAGLMTISRPAAADETQFEKGDAFEPRATREKPVWECVEVKFLEKAKDLLSLADIRANPKLAKMVLLQKGSRLSVQPVTPAEFREIARMAGFKSA